MHSCSCSSSGLSARLLAAPCMGLVARSLPALLSLALLPALALGTEGPPDGAAPHLLHAAEQRSHPGALPYSPGGHVRPYTRLCDHPNFWDYDTQDEDDGAYGVYGSWHGGWHGGNGNDDWWSDGGVGSWDELCWQLDPVPLEEHPPALELPNPQPPLPPVPSDHLTKAADPRAVHHSVSQPLEERELSPCMQSGDVQRSNGEEFQRQQETSTAEAADAPTPWASAACAERRTACAPGTGSAAAPRPPVVMRHVLSSAARASRAHLTSNHEDDSRTGSRGRSSSSSSASERGTAQSTSIEDVAAADVDGLVQRYLQRHARHRSHRRPEQPDLHANIESVRRAGEGEDAAADNTYQPAASPTAWALDSNQAFPGEVLHPHDYYIEVVEEALDYEHTQSGGPQHGGPDDRPQRQGTFLRRLAQLTGLGGRGSNQLPSSVIVPVSIVGFNCSALSGLAACAEPQCADFFALVRGEGGAVTCEQVAPIPPVTGGTGTVSTTIIVPYQYDYLFQFGNSIVLSGLSLGVQALDNRRWATQINTFPTRERDSIDTARVATARGSLSGYEGVLQREVASGTQGNFDDTEPLTFNFGTVLRSVSDTLIQRLSLPGFSASNRVLGSDPRVNTAFGLSNVILG